MNYLEIARAARDRWRQARASNADAASLSMALAQQVLSLSLSDFRQEGSIIEIRVPYLDVTLFFVPTEREVFLLQNEGISRGRIWTTDELLDVLSIGSMTRDQVAQVARAKAALAGDVVNVIRREVSEESVVSPASIAPANPGSEEREVSEKRESESPHHAARREVNNDGRSVEAGP